MISKARMSTMEKVAWNPSKMVGGIRPICWLDADSVSGNDGDLVSTWADKSGNSNNFTQAGTKRPTLKKSSNGINGHNVVRFDGSTNLMVASNFLSSTSGSVFVVYRLSSPIAALQQQLLSSADENTSSFYMWLTGSVSNTLPAFQVAQRNNDTADDLRGTTFLVTDVPILVGFISSGTAYTVRYHGSEETMTLTTGTNSGDWFGDTLNRDSTSIGASKRNTETRFLKGDIAELIIYNAELSAKDCGTVERYLALKYGIWTSSSRELKVYRTDANNFNISNKVDSLDIYTQWHMQKSTTVLSGWTNPSNGWSIRDLTVMSGAGVILGNKSSAWEYAFSIGASGDIAGDYDWYGSIHQAQLATSSILVLDNRDITNLAVGETRFGSRANLIQAFTNYYPKDKVSVCGYTVLEHDFYPNYLDVSHNHTFNPGYMLTTSYSAMAPTTISGVNTYKVGSNSPATRVSDGNPKNKPTQTDTIDLYHTSHQFKLTLKLPTGYPGNATWDFSGDWKAWFLDGAEPDNGKAYVTWVDGDFADRITAIDSSHQARYIVSKA